VTYSIEIVERIKKKHRLSGDPLLLPSTGMVNEAWGIGSDYVLRINQHEECDDEAPREAVIVPLVIAAGVRSPELLVLDNERDIVPRPFTVYRRAPGVLLGSLDVDPASLSHLYEEIGREIALLHRMDVSASVSPPRPDWEAWEVRKQVGKALDAGCISKEDFEEMESWIDFVEPNLGKKGADTLVHKDIHPWNLMVDPETYNLTAILDWGDARMGDASAEFASMTLVAVPGMFRGYQAAGEVVSDPLIARALYAGLGLASWEIRDVGMQNYKRQWWRMPTDGWQGFKRCLARDFPFLLPANLRMKKSISD
jgi:hygromycin-B 7''-O-kinase